MVIGALAFRIIGPAAGQTIGQVEIRSVKDFDDDSKLAAMDIVQLVLVS